MLVADKKVVSIHYTVANGKGEEFESSRGREPMSYLHGAGNLVSGLEKALAGKAPGERFEITLEPAEAYGERRENRIQRIPSKHFRNAEKLRPGQWVSIQTRTGAVQAAVVKVGRFNVDVDTNHPLAGQSLTFDVEVMSVRDATPEEISHGHVHGSGGAHD